MTPEKKTERLADAIVGPFPEGITDEQIIWQAINRGLLPELAKHMSDNLLIDTWWIRNHNDAYVMFELMAQIQLRLKRKENKL